MRRLAAAIPALMLVVALGVPAMAAQLRMVMFEEAGCVWCERWNREIGPIWPRTEEGKRAPLERRDLSGGTAGLELRRPVIFTPTFVLVCDGREIGRIEGYPGEHFFWPLVDELLARLDNPDDPAGRTNCATAQHSLAMPGAAPKQERAVSSPAEEETRTPPRRASALGARAQEVADFLKAMSHENRLMILCHLAEGEKSVSELEELLMARQAAVSQQLARLRLQGLVTWRREGKMIFYRLTDPRAERVLALLQELFLPPAPTGDDASGETAAERDSREQECAQWRA